ncbi:MAG: hypothetical protein QOJ07_851 [Thermoleophilaceae bacterium]|nr:hypothetical protein [Thermoleophilaceae bacterium]
MSTWTAHTTVAAEPCAVLGVLTDPEAIRSWSPIDFELDELDGDRLYEGATARVSGRLARLGASFDVEVEAAHAARFALVASGPVDLEVDYELFPDGEHTDVWVSLGVRPAGGLSGRLIAQATEALLRAGALDRALGRIAQEFEITNDQERTHDVEQVPVV